MRRRVFSLCLAVLLLTGGGTLQAFAYENSAASAVLIEQESGRVLYGKAADEPRLIASITKILTAVVALERGDLRSQYRVCADDMAEGSSMYLVPGEKLTLEELLFGLMLASGNDAALAVARCVSGDVETFVVHMNTLAQQLGMRGSHFCNPNGLDAPEHYSTAEDMAKLTAYALENEDFRRIVSTVSVEIGGRTLTNHNKLLRLCEGCIGVKTGYTRAAGRTLVSAVEREGMTLICVTLMDGDDWNDHISLYSRGFRDYRRLCFGSEGAVAACVSVSGGTVPLVPLILDRPLCYPVAEGEELCLKVEAPLKVSAPVLPGQKLGRACLELGGKKVASVDLIAAAPSAVDVSHSGGL